MIGIFLQHNCFGRVRLLTLSNSGSLVILFVKERKQEITRNSKTTNDFYENIVYLNFLNCFDSICFCAMYSINQSVQYLM